MGGQLRSPVLVGREDELARLRELATSVRGGEAAAVLLGGDAGIGKTRLLTEFLDSLEDTTVLIGGCMGLTDAAAPYVPVIEILRELRHQRGEDELRRLLTGPCDLLRRLLPGGTQSAVEDRLPARGAGARLHEAVISLLETLAAEQPLVLGIEDVHWASPSTLDLLTFLARSRPRGPVLLLVTFRTDELHRRHPLRPVLAEIGRLDGVERLDLAPLSPAAQRRQLAAILGGPPSDDLVRDIVARAEGNAFYAEELLAASAEASADQRALPATLQEILVHRLASLPEDATEVLRVAAAAGRSVDHELLAAVAPLDPTAQRTGLRAAVEHGVLVADGRRYRFRHALLQEAVHDDLLPGERAQLHRSLADALRADPSLAADGEDGADAELAHHAHEAGLVDEAWTASVRAAERAATAHAFAEALAHHERALALLERCSDQARAAGPDRRTLLRAAAAMASNVGAHRRADALLTAALDDLTFDNTEERAALLAELAFQQGWHGAWEQAMATLEQAVELAPGPTPARAAALAASALSLLVYGSPEDAVAPAREAILLAEQHGLPEALVLATNALGGALMDRGETEDGLALFRRSIAVAEEHGIVEWVVGGYVNQVDGLWSATDRLEDALTVALEGLAYAERAGWEGVVTDFLRVAVVGMLLDAGDVAAADRHAAALRFRPESGQLLGAHLTIVAELRLAQGRVEEAAALLVQGRDALDRVREPQHAAPLAAARARTALAAGRLEEAWSLLDEARSHPLVHVRHDPVRPLAARVVAAQVAAAPSDDDVLRSATDRLDALGVELDGLLDDESDEGRRTALLRTAVAQLEAERTRVLGTPDPAAWELAEQGVARQGRQPELAELQVRRAEALVGAGRRGEAAALLATVHATCVERGLMAAAEQAEAVARRARIVLDGVAERDGHDDAFGLTPREREVLALVADGLTNRAIGERLFIAGKTASVHVSNILTKLEASTRGEAAAIARRHGLDGDPS